MATKKPAKTTAAATPVTPAPKVMAKYNRSLDCIALAMELGRRGRHTMAAKAFAAAINDKSAVAAINTLTASNAQAVKAMQARKLEAAKLAASSKKLKAEPMPEENEDEDLSDEDIDKLLNGDEEVDASDEEPEAADEDEDEDADGDMEDGEPEDEDGDDGLAGDDDEDGDDDAGQEEFAKVIARLSKKDGKKS